MICTLVEIGTIKFAIPTISAREKVHRTPDSTNSLSQVENMPKSLEKTRKKISKKKGNITALHENSRDVQRLKRAGMRDDKLAKVTSRRRKNDRPLGKGRECS